MCVNTQSDVEPTVGEAPADLLKLSRLGKTSRLGACNRGELTRKDAGF